MNLLAACLAKSLLLNPCLLGDGLEFASAYQAPHRPSEDDALQAGVSNLLLIGAGGRTASTEKYIVGFPGTAGINPQAGVDYYFAPNAGRLNDMSIASLTSSTNNVVKQRGAATVKDFYLRVESNAHTNPLTFTLYKNGSDTSLSITVAAGTTGNFDDLYANTGHSVSLADGDTWCWHLSGGSGTGNILFTGGLCCMEYAGSGGAIISTNGNGTASATASATRYGRFPCSAQTFTSVQAQSVMPCAGTLDMMQCRAGTNARSTTTTVTIRKNGADAISVSVPSSDTNINENTVNSVHFDAGDLLDYTYTTGTGTGTFTLVMVSARFVPDVPSTTPLITQMGGVTQAAAQRYLGWGKTTNATEANVYAKSPFNATYSKMAVSVSANTSGDDKVYSSRDNAGAGTQTFTITANTTGVFKDTTHSDSLSAGEFFAMSAAANTGGASTTLESWAWAVTAA